MQARLVRWKHRASSGMGGWFYILKAIFMSEAGGVAGECSQAFKEAFREAAAHYMYMREYLVQVHE